jgi:hypothetical protein
MSLLNMIATAKGDAAHTYAKGGRHLVTIAEAFFLEPDLATGGKRSTPLVGFRGQVFHSTSPMFEADVEGGFGKGTVLTVNDGCKFPSGIARLRRGLAAAKMVKEGLPHCNQETLGLVRGDNETLSEFHARVVEEANRLLGPKQPLVGALVVFNCVERAGKVKPDGSRGSYTLFEVEVPTEQDLKVAGLLDESVPF